MPKLYLDDFEPGHTVRLGTHTFTEQEIIEFAQQFDPQPFHIDRAAAEQTMFGGIIASGWHTCSMAMRKMCDAYLLDSASLGSPGLDEIRWLKPVRPGDTITYWRKILEVKPSASKPDRGASLAEWEARNQHGDVVMRMRGWGMFMRRPRSEDHTHE